tara:strand:- start:430 stop:633 length:204 start_codon:yes stop_codon:yes gene_type:complete
MSDQMVVAKQKWYAKLPQTPFLVEVIITEVTSKTVAMRPTSGSATTRFKYDDVEFVEEVVEVSKVIT